MDDSLKTLKEKIKTAHHQCCRSIAGPRKLKEILSDLGFSLTHKENSPSRFGYAYTDLYEKKYQDQKITITVVDDDAFPFAKYSSTLDLSLSYQGETLYRDILQVPSRR